MTNENGNVIPFLIIGILIGGILIGALITIFVYENERFENSKLFKGYGNDSLFRLEQTVACYQGCKIDTQIMYQNNVSFSQNKMVDIYNRCTSLCKSWYR